MKFLILLALMALSSFAHAREFGLGIVLGSEGPLTGKYYLNPNRSMQVHLGAHDGQLYLVSDYLWEKQKAFRVENVVLNFYAGVGVSIEGEEENKRGHKEKDTFVGPRVPLGVNFYLLQNQLEIFTELAPGIYVSPEAESFIVFGLGTRWFF